MTVPEKLVRDYEYVKSIYGEQILGIFLYGSQNYGIATEESDVDVKAIYVPTLREVAANKPLVSEELKIGDEHIEVKDVRLMSQMWKKGSINFLEILFTDYSVVNPIYREDWEKVLKIRNLITERTKDKTLAAACYEGYNKINSKKVTKKDVANSHRLLEFCWNYSQFNSFGGALPVPAEAVNHLIALKKHGKEEADKAQIKYLKELYSELMPEIDFSAGKKKVNEVLDIQLDKWVSDILIYSFTEKRRGE